MAGPRLAVFGNLILDDVVHADGSTRMGQPGGAALYVALGAWLWGVEVGIVSAAGEDYPAELLGGLHGLGIDLAGVRRVDGPSLRTWLLYEGRRRRVVHRLDGPGHAAASPRPEDLPASWRPEISHLAPMPFAVQRRLVGELALRPERISLDPYELVREERLADWHELLARIDLLFLGEDEMELAGGLDRPEPALRRLAAAGGRLEQVVYKRGARGGLLYQPGGDRFRRWRAAAGEVVEPTGAGDALAGGFLAGELLGDTPERALARGLVSAGFALAASGPDGLLAATPEQAAARLATAG